MQNLLLAVAVLLIASVIETFGYLFPGMGQNSSDDSADAMHSESLLSPEDLEMEKQNPRIWSEPIVPSAASIGQYVFTHHGDGLGISGTIVGFEGASAIVEPLICS